MAYLSHNLKEREERKEGKERKRKRRGGERRERERKGEMGREPLS